MAMLSAARRLSRILWSRNKFVCPYSTASPQVSEEPTLAYAVRRRDPELVGPASLTPRESKPLSDLDDVLRMHLSLALFYRGRQDGGFHPHPAGVIRRALGEALVHYYPLAGRLREMEGGKLAVDCTGEGVLFVQADADVRLADLEAAGPGLRPPFPCWDRLLLDVEGSSGVLDTPLMLIQVTRLLCGGFVLALRFSHTICDWIGIAQFLNALSELARGLPSITVTPVWSRDLIKARCPPMQARRPELDLVPRAPPDMVTRSFNFSATDVAKMKKSLCAMGTATTLEALAAFVWRARTAALDLPPGQDAQLAIVVNLRRAGMLGLPAGYYGNASVPLMALVDSAALCHGSLGDAVALVRLAKASLTAQHARSMVDEAVLLGRGMFIPNRLGVSDTRSLGFASVDLGWGEPVFAGPAGPLIYGWSYFLDVKDRDGEDAVCVPVVLPPRAMLRFQAEVERSLEAY